MLLGPSSLPDGDLISENNFDGFHHLTASICSAREVSLGKRCRDSRWMLIKRPRFNLQLHDSFNDFCVGLPYLTTKALHALPPICSQLSVISSCYFDWTELLPKPPLLPSAEHLIPPLTSLDCSRCFFSFDVWLFRPFVFLSYTALRNYGAG